jgi:hypothetical protein
VNWLVSLMVAPITELTRRFRCGAAPSFAAGVHRVTKNEVAACSRR